MKKLPRSRKPSCSLVLWGEGFEEGVATTFVTQLRAAGLCVRIVGLYGQRARGHYGLTLCADITVTTALTLAARASAVIIPCNATLLRGLTYDPRFAELLAQAKRNGAHFILREPKALQTPLCQPLALNEAERSFYAPYLEKHEIERFAYAMTQQLMLLTSG